VNESGTYQVQVRFYTERVDVNKDAAGNVLPDSRKFYSSLL